MSLLKVSSPRRLRNTVIQWVSPYPSGWLTGGWDLFSWGRRCQPSLPLHQNITLDSSPPLLKQFYDSFTSMKAVYYSLFINNGVSIIRSWGWEQNAFKRFRTEAQNSAQVRQWISHVIVLWMQLVILKCVLHCQHCREERYGEQMSSSMVKFSRNTVIGGATFSEYFCSVTCLVNIAHMLATWIIAHLM